MSWLFLNRHSGESRYPERKRPARRAANVQTRFQLALERRWWSIGALVFGAIGPGQAQNFPTRPIRIVVPSTPGGGLDIVARIMSPRLTEKWGQQIVVDNRAGAGGVIGTDIVSKAAPDGHTLLVVTTGFVTNPFLLKQLPYRTPQDFEPIMVVGYTPVVLVVHPSLPAKSVKELIAMARDKPNAIPFGSSGTGSGGFLAMTAMQREAGIRFVHVPYKGAGALTAAVVAGEVPLVFTAPGSALAQVKAGRLRALVATSAKRVSVLPDVPSVVEVGLPGCVMDGWYGYFAPAGTPAPLIDRIYRDFNAIVQMPEVSAKLQGAGFELGGMGPAPFKQYIASEMKRWEAVIRESGLKPE
jgi:tripartite-type tricarboxylate transporter receptor subunit TctC